jgi:hypothetical protein
LLVDTRVQMAAFVPKNVWYSYETADAVERETFTIIGISLSDFVYLAWFESFRNRRKVGGTKAIARQGRPRAIDMIARLRAGIRRRRL